MLGDLSGKNRTSVGNLRNHSWIVGKCSGRKLSNASSRVLDIPWDDEHNNFSEYEMALKSGFAQLFPKVGLKTFC